MPPRKGVAGQRPRGEHRTRVIKVNVTPAELAYAQKLADAAGKSTSAWAFEVLAPLLTRAHLPTPDPDQPPLFDDQEKRP